MRFFVPACFVFSLLVGSICPMQMAEAMRMPSEQEPTVDMAMMTPMEIMSPLHCDHCGTVLRQESPPLASDCSGHCLFQGAAAVTAATQLSPQFEASAGLPPSTLSHQTLGRDHVPIASTGSPVFVSMTRTVVLLQ